MERGEAEGDALGLDIAPDTEDGFPLEPDVSVPVELPVLLPVVVMSVQLVPVLVPVLLVVVPVVEVELVLAPEDWANRMVESSLALVADFSPSQATAGTASTARTREHYRFFIPSIRGCSRTRF